LIDAASAAEELIGAGVMRYLLLLVIPAQAGIQFRPQRVVARFDVQKSSRQLSLIATGFRPAPE
jgi:hypothetical protein